MQIREANRQDSDKLLPLLIESERYHNVELDKDKVDKKGLEAQARNDLSLWFRPQYQGYVLEDEDKIVGLVLAQTGDVVGKGWIEDLYVAPEYRRQSWAQRLLKTAIDWLKTKGVDKVKLDVHRLNPPAISLYKRVGFREKPPKWLYFEKDI